MDPRPFAIALIALTAPTVAQDPAPTIRTEDVASRATNLTIQVRDADVTTVLWRIAREAGANVVVAPEVQGKVTMDVVDVPWREAMDSAVEVLGFRVEERGGVLRVIPGARPEPGRVRFAFEDADIRKVIDSIARISGANIVVAPEVQGRISMRLQGVGWRDALTAAVETLGFVVREHEAGILRIVASERIRNTSESKVTVNFEDLDIRAAIQDIADQANANVAIAAGVQGKLTIRLREIGYTDALEAIAESLGYSVHTDTAGIVRIR